ncbi:extracellular solute-binding protein [Archangium lansingense]|uniref:Extracellular solute-binding protein n=1 Tax=Archangium lansingense TaxID=2995310 RepID=A0ABT4AA46_9BACT|nr:extracellular solute-binding protein [Archangium lansinium]MCY1078524.1 extracellular solute-binding protein [Archangium lansinium]
MIKRVLTCAILLSATACEPPDEPPEKPRPLKAVLFPYIPDSAGDGFASLEQALEKGFEDQHPGIDLDIVFDVNLDVYDLSEGGTLNQLLGEGEGAAQVIEIDTLLLGDLVSRGWIQPVQETAAEVYPAARLAVSIEGKSYGVPTYLCTNVVYSGSTLVHSATDGRSLVRALSDIAPGKLPLATNFSGSWTLPSSYMDAWADTYPAAQLASAIALPLDAKAMDSFEAVVDSCAREQSSNPCLDGTYADNTLAEEAFAKGQANGFMGYTERLFFIRKANPALPLPQVTSVPLGEGTHPAVFVDALVFNSHCTGTCQGDAQAFAKYMSTPEVRTLIAFSKDAPEGALPRYLLQANRSFYQQEPARSDPMYQQYEPFVSHGRPYPNQGFPENRKALQKAILDELEYTPATTSTRAAKK